MEKHKIGFIGTGMRTVWILLEMLKREEFEVVAISDISQEAMDMVCEKFNTQWDQYTDYRDLLAREDIEGVVICSPDYAHKEQAIAAFEAGKHVFLEKPIATTIEGGKKVLQKRDESGKTLLIGFVLRYNKLYKKMKELIESGIIGKVHTGWVLHSVGAASDWYFHDWHGTMKNTGGLLLQKGSHDFDIINWIIDSKVEKVAAFGSRNFFGGDKPNDLICQECDERFTCSEATKDSLIPLKRADGSEFIIHYNVWRNQCAFREEIDVLDDHHVILKYKNGAKVTYLECHNTPEDNREYYFIGTKGKLKLDDKLDTITVQFRHGMRDRKEVMTISNLQLSEGHGGGDKYILDDFVKALETGLQPNAGGEEGLHAIEIGLKSHEAIRKEQVIKIQD